MRPLVQPSSLMRPMRARCETIAPKTRGVAVAGQTKLAAFKASSARRDSWWSNPRSNAAAIAALSSGGVACSDRLIPRSLSHPARCIGSTLVFCCSGVRVVPTSVFVIALGTSPVAAGWSKVLMVFMARPSELSERFAQRATAKRRFDHKQPFAHNAKMGRANVCGTDQPPTSEDCTAAFRHIPRLSSNWVETQMANSALEDCCRYLPPICFWCFQHSAAQCQNAEQSQELTGELLYVGPLSSERPWRVWGKEGNALEPPGTAWFVAAHAR